MFLLMFSILWELLVLCSRLHLGRIIFSPLKKIGKNQSFLLKATLYCVAARKENVPFPSFLSLSRQEQTAALAPEMPPQSIPSLRAWVRGIGSAWWSSHPLTSHGVGGMLRGLPCKSEHPEPHHVALAPLQGSLFLWLVEVSHKRDRYVHPQSSFIIVTVF